jgi:hypothetical protein
VVAAAPQRRAETAIAAVTSVRTVAGFSIESYMLYLLYPAGARRSDRRAGNAAAVVVAELDPNRS